MSGRTLPVTALAFLLILLVPACRLAGWALPRRFPRTRGVLFGVVPAVLLAGIILITVAVLLAS
ncbi:hypothetical protein IMZ11_21385 [Microtetraspora sp. AC03309]|uniref:hypothetical protein n=1 Tax=Microtetraspora sp. AC03309 TaxID=2779376 RepID=UPI001E53B335|nr:hypothetical protein [Microtetraspora sp. AC03309]MCC5578182.1 hypothetical protein [Microtetraspora sp. AC03309]